MSDQSSQKSAEPFDSETLESVRATRMGISLDWWSVIVAVVLAVLVWQNLLPKIPWNPTPEPAKAAAVDAHPK